MTFLQKDGETNPEEMEGLPNKDDSGGKSSRPVRNRRYTRRSLVAGQRPQKRLFTPEIKRYLKDWLVRRRENPYPNREEKKYLSRETGLTYIQICNWFANWRRKLKNVNADRNQQNWGLLIRTYNDRAQGNVEQFSICSDDSIWSEPANSLDHGLDMDTGSVDMDSPEQESQQDSDTSSTYIEKFENNNFYTAEQRYPELTTATDESKMTSPLLLSKWLESAARFQPSESNYSLWDGRRRKTEVKQQKITLTTSRHDRDEVEAAVALTALATATSRVTAK